MTRKGSASRELVVGVYLRLMAAMDDTALLTMEEPLLDVASELEDVDTFLEGLLSAVTPTSKPCSAKAVPELVSGTKPITVRVHKRVINAFKAEAIKTGIGYQTLMHQALADATEEFAL